MLVLSKLFKVTEDLSLAVKYEELDMTLEMTRDKITGLNKKIENKPRKDGTYRYTTEQVEAFKIEKIQLESDMDKLAEELADVTAIYEKVVEEFCTPNEKGYSNDAQNVRNILRVIATADNTKLEKYALKSGIGSEALFNALETIHDISTATDDGKQKNSKAVRDAYKTSASEIQSELNACLSLSIATIHNDALRVKFNNTQLMALQESYVKGYAVKYKKTDDGVVYNGVSGRHSITRKEKDGNVEYDYTALATTVTKLTIANLAK